MICEVKFHDLKEKLQFNLKEEMFRTMLGCVLFLTTAYTYIGVLLDDMEKNI